MKAALVDTEGESGVANGEGHHRSSSDERGATAGSKSDISDATIDYMHPRVELAHAARSIDGALSATRHAVVALRFAETGNSLAVRNLDDGHETSFGPYPLGHRASEWYAEVASTFALTPALLPEQDPFVAPEGAETWRNRWYGTLVDFSSLQYVVEATDARPDRLRLCLPRGALLVLRRPTGSWIAALGFEGDHTDYGFDIAEWILHGGKQYPQSDIHLVDRARTQELPSWASDQI